MIVPRATSTSARPPAPLAVENVDLLLWIYEGATPVVAVELAAPPGSSMERMLPDIHGQSHDIEIALGTYDAAHDEQVLTLHYVTEGTELREVLRCEVGRTVQRFAGGRRLELKVLRVPAPRDTKDDAAPREQVDEDASEETPSVWVIPDAEDAPTPPPEGANTRYL